LDLGHGERDERAPMSAERSPVVEGAGAHASEIGRIHIAGVTTRRSGREIDVEVELGAGAIRAQGRATGPNTRFEARRVVGRAALEALQRLVEGDLRLSLGEMGERSLGSRRVLLACVIRSEDRAETAFLGSCEVGHEPEQAVVHAILDAVAGWVGGLPPREPVEWVIGPASDPGR
jgi:hypothetical protein